MSIKQSAARLLDSVGLKLDVNIPAGRLSIAQRQLVKMAKAQSLNSSLIIMDEPTKSIDVGAKSDVQQIIKGIAKEGKGIILNSYELKELLTISDRIIVMRDGVIRGEMTREEKHMITTMIVDDELWVCQLIKNIVKWKNIGLLIIGRPVGEDIDLKLDSLDVDNLLY